MPELTVWYDQEGDYLEVTFEDAPATLEEIDDNIFERRMPDGRVVGFAVVNLSQHDQELLKLPLVVTAVSSAA